MLGDWIALRIDLWDCPQVVRILSAFCPHDVHDKSQMVRTKSQVIGALYRIWSLFDSQSTDGKLTGYSKEYLDSEVGMVGFSAAMEECGWLVVESPQILIMPEFNKWLSKSAKKRLKDRERKKQARLKGDSKMSAKRPRNVRKTSAMSHGHSFDMSSSFQSEDEKEKSLADAKSVDPKSHRKKTNRDLLFDAIVEITGVDPENKGSLIGKEINKLLKVNPPYTPEEVRKLPESLTKMEILQGKPITVTMIASWMHLVRGKEKCVPISSNPNGAMCNNGHIESKKSRPELFNGTGIIVDKKKDGSIRFLHPENEVCFFTLPANKDNYTITDEIRDKILDSFKEKFG